MSSRIKFSILAFCVVALTSTHSFAQTTPKSQTKQKSSTITGKVIDSSTQEPLSFVSVVVISPDGEYLAGGTTDIDGAFQMNKIPAGVVNMSFSFVGYKTVDKSITVEGDTNVDDVILEPDATEIESIQITGMKSQMRFEVDKKVFNVDQNIASVGGSASEILSNIPSVEVDNDGEISLRGSTSVTIWINGKASGLSADNRAQILEQMPAETIEKVEIITNPSAKYSPEGTAGIINIVLKKDRKAGYFGSAQVSGNTLGNFNASGSINANMGKFDTYASLGYRNHRRLRAGETIRTNTDGTELSQNSTSTRTSGGFFARAGATYHLTDKDQFSVAAFGMLSSRTNDEEIDYKSNMSSLFQTSTRRSLTQSENIGGSLQLGYKHEFGDNHNIDFTATYNVWEMESDNIYNQESLFADGRETKSYQNQYGDISPANLEIQLDYINSFNENHKIEAGYFGKISRDDSPSSTKVGTSEEDAIFDPNFYNRFIFNEDIHALYGTFTGKVGNFGYQAGLRGEYTSTFSQSIGDGETTESVTPYKVDYFKLFPTVFLNYQLPNDHELQLNYTRRISRPRGRNLNSHVNLSDSLNISYGNPELLPQYSNALELNYMKAWQDHLISVSTYYRTSDNVIQRIGYLEEGIMNSTYENVAENQTLGAELVVKNSLFKMLDLTTTFNFYHYKLDGFSYNVPNSNIVVEGNPQEDFSWSARMIANFMFPKSYSLQLSGTYQSRQVLAQGYREPYFYVNMGVRKKIGDWGFNLSARDLFLSRKFTTVTSGAGFDQNYESWSTGYEVRLTVTYGFGNMKKSRKPQDDKGGESGMDSGYDDADY